MCFYSTQHTAIIRTVSFCTCCNGQMGESDCLCRRGKYTIKLWVLRDCPPTPNPSKDWWFAREGEAEGERIKWMKSLRVKLCSRDVERQSSWCLLIGAITTHSGAEIMTWDFGVFTSGQHPGGGGVSSVWLIVGILLFIEVFYRNVL